MAPPLEVWLCGKTLVSRRQDRCGVSDAFAAPDAAFPALRGATVFEADLRPGDLIFVPAGLPHQVVNVEATVAVSVNFVDETNLDDAIDALFLACEGCESGVRPDFELTRRRLIALRDELMLE